MSFIGVILDSKKFQAMQKFVQKNTNKIDITLININKKSIKNVKNVKFDIIVIGEPLEKFQSEIEYIKKFCDQAKYLVINSDLEIKENILNNVKSNIITFGLNHKSTVTLSSITDEMVLISVQREFENMAKALIEVGEYSIETKKENRTNIHEIMTTFIIINLNSEEIIYEIKTK